jgi:carbon monoxide dehydrogenase subunit G
MAMTMSGEVQLPATREAVWAKLNDAETLKACIPGCEDLTMLSATEFEAVAVNKIGPVKPGSKARSRSPTSIRRNGYKISGRATAALPVSPRAARRSSWPKRTGARLLTYNVEAQIGGKLAQLGQRLVNGAAKKLADDFFEKFAAAVRAA